MAQTTNGSINIDTGKLVNEAEAIIGHVEAMRTWLEDIKYYYENIHEIWKSDAGDLIRTNEVDVLNKMEKTLESYNALTDFMQQVALQYLSTERRVKEAGSSFEN